MIERMLTIIRNTAKIIATDVFPEAAREKMRTKLLRPTGQRVGNIL